MSWRKNDDPMAEARRLGVDKAITNLKWSPARLEREMALSETEQMFKGRIRGALQREAQKEADQTRFLAREPDPYRRMVMDEDGRPYTDRAELALPNELPGVDDETLKAFADDGRLRLTAEREANLRAILEDKSLSLEQRLAAVREEARRLGIDTRSLERGMERRIGDFERRVQSRRGQANPSAAKG